MPQLVKVDDDFQVEWDVFGAIGEIDHYEVKLVQVNPTNGQDLSPVMTIASNLPAGLKKTLGPSKFPGQGGQRNLWYAPMVRAVPKNILTATPSEGYGEAWAVGFDPQQLLFPKECWQTTGANAASNTGAAINAGGLLAPDTGIGANAWRRNIGIGSSQGLDMPLCAPGLLAWNVSVRRAPTGPAARGIAVDFDAGNLTPGAPYVLIAEVGFDGRVTTEKVDVQVEVSRESADPLVELIPREAVTRVPAPGSRRLQRITRTFRAPPAPPPGPPLITVTFSNFRDFVPGSPNPTIFGLRLVRQ
jgi:hypothetical protein